MGTALCLLMSGVERVSMGKTDEEEALRVDSHDGTRRNSPPDWEGTGEPDMDCVLQ